MEEWRPIPDADGYQASSCGRIRSIDRPVRTKGGVMGQRRGKVLKPRPYGRYNHQCVSVRTNDARRRNMSVHKLVSLAFHGPKPCPDHEVRHLNGDPTDNRPCNLRWGTRKENAADRALHGRFRSNLPQLQKEKA